jgi:2-keto-4-pentenoate hydratase/2-oxohepta-3-ene-1,7-dioic acid hydratase in catechol pathway
VELWARYEHDGRHGFGTVAGDRLIAHDGDLFGQSSPAGEDFALGDVRLLPPAMPGKFIGLWNNSESLRAKLGLAVPKTPLYFLKAPSSIIGNGERIFRPPAYSGKVLYEAELGIVIGRMAYELDETEAEGAIFGYTCVNDVTALDLLDEDPSFPQWARAKSCNTFGPVGPYIARGLDWRQFVIKGILNGRERQNYPATDLIFSPPRIVSALSREMELLPGDLIACGTSTGALPLRDDASIVISIEGIGTLENVFSSKTMKDLAS